MWGNFDTAVYIFVTGLRAQQTNPGLYFYRVSPQPLSSPCAVCGVQAGSVCVGGVAQQCEDISVRVIMGWREEAGSLRHSTEFCQNVMFAPGLCALRKVVDRDGAPHPVLGRRQAAGKFGWVVVSQCLTIPKEGERAFTKCLLCTRPMQARAVCANLLQYSRNYRR